MPYLAQIMPSNLLWMPYSLFSIFAAIGNYLTPNLLNDGTSDKGFIYFFLGVFLCQFMALVLVVMFVVNLEGLQKDEIRRVLRGAKLERSKD